ncbi:concanavalin A-like lectin/glucanase domain-containing protein [Aspergillus falconensis]
MKTPTLISAAFLTLTLTLTPTTAHGHGHNHHHKPHSHGARAISSRGLNSGPNKPLLAGYSLTWHEEFSYSSSGAIKQPSTAKWLYATGQSYPANWGDHGLQAQSYAENVEIIHLTEQGSLSITPRKKSDGPWTSARIETVRKDFKAERGGKLFIEARIKTGCADAGVSMPTQKEVSPANAFTFRFWALGAEIRGNDGDTCLDWPAVSEWDIAEIIDGEDTVHHTLHCGTAPGGPCREFAGLTSSATWTDCHWHYLGFEVDRTQFSSDGVELWRDNTLNWYVDGVKTFSLSGRDVNDRDAWEKIAYQGHFLLLDVAAGRDLTGVLDDGRESEGTDARASWRLEVDYIRIWNR